MKVIMESHSRSIAQTIAPSGHDEVGTSNPTRMHKADDESFWFDELMANPVNDGGSGSGTVPTATTSSDEYYKYIFGATIAALKHDPGLSSIWSPEEIPLIHHLFVKYASESTVTKYAKIAQHLNDKTTRDVILYHKWLIQNKRENRKRRNDDDNSSKKNKDKKVEVADPLAKASSHLANGSSSRLTNGSNDHPYAQTTASMDSDDGISYKAIGGAAGRLLEQNAKAMDQISANFRAFKIYDNIDLFCQARNNILSLLKDMNENDVPEIMKQMPPLPVKLNQGLSSYLLPPPPSTLP